jgi:hypothetical protein
MTRALHYVSIGINVTFLALFAWIWVVTRSDVVLPWCGYFVFQGALSSHAVWRKRGIRA